MPKSDARRRLALFMELERDAVEHGWYETRLLEAEARRYRAEGSVEL